MTDDLHSMIDNLHYKLDHGDESAEQRYLYERAGVLATAVGIARLHLQNGEPDEALKALDHYCAKLKLMHYEALLEDGWLAQDIEKLLGPLE